MWNDANIEDAEVFKFETQKLGELNLMRLHAKASTKFVVGRYFNKEERVRTFLRNHKNFKTDANAFAWGVSSDLDEKATTRVESIAANKDLSQMFVPLQPQILTAMIANARERGHTHIYANQPNEDMRAICAGFGIANRGATPTPIAQVRPLKTIFTPDDIATETIREILGK